MILNSLQINAIRNFKNKTDDKSKYIGNSMIELIQGNRPKELINVLEQIITVIQDDSFKDKTGIIYLGYPLIKTPDGTKTVHALLVSEQLGAFAFDLISPNQQVSSEEVTERQDIIYNQLEAKLRATKEITNGRQLAFNLNVVTFAPTITNKADFKNNDNFFTTPEELLKYLQKANSGILKTIYNSLKGVLQGVSKLKQPKDRPEVQTTNTKGHIAQQLEHQMAHLDIYQNKAIVEMTDSPQRITGLAGTGKTVVIAGKVAYLHAINPNLRIAITFYSRSLYHQYRLLLTRLYFNQTQEEPDWSKITLLHAWGGSTNPGFYTTICKANGITPMRYDYAKDKYGQSNAFVGVCDEALQQIKNPNEIFDYVLIDEAQDMPRSFFELAYLSTTSPHRVVWAYDELQQLTQEQTVAEPDILFGKNSNQQPRFTFTSNDENPNDDIILRVCYRNPKQVITTAHALGLGVYSDHGPLQMIEDVNVWNRIGYRVTGTIAPNNNVELARESDANPEFLESYLKGTDIVSYKISDTIDEQDDWIAKEIIKNLTEDELQPNDILIIALGPVYNIQGRTSRIRQTLRQANILTHIAGVASADEYFREGSVAISQIFRAKGNEAPMIYILDAQTCSSGSELIVKRNKLFTAITRSRGWVRICGVGDAMKSLAKEIDEVKKNNYDLKFKVPTDLAARRKLHGEMSKAKKNKKNLEVKRIQGVLESLEKGQIDLTDIPTDLLEKLKKMLKN